jgi:hypothetical protein
MHDATDIDARVRRIIDLVKADSLALSAYGA